jgi:6,7-dimethyl-8-ribityllumazine synthase
VEKNGMMTQTQKIRKPVVTERYHDIINDVCLIFAILKRSGGYLASLLITAASTFELPLLLLSFVLSSSTMDEFNKPSLGSDRI